jgi:hypothetical protein
VAKAEDKLAENKLIYLGSGQTAEQQGIPKSFSPKLGQLTDAERLQLRKARFIKGGDNSISTVEALQLLEEQKRKKLERAARFGVET